MVDGFPSDNISDEEQFEVIFDRNKIEQENETLKSAVLQCNFLFHSYELVVEHHIQFHSNESLQN
jgi:hypothetical protein